MKIDKMILKKKQIYEIQRLLLNMEITYMYGSVLVIHSESIEVVGIFHKAESYHKTRSYLIRLAIKTSLLFQKKNIISLFSLE